ncbi:hypothetical protein M7I_0871 [Glarea lozoyensis 74030]|uniref:Uncharacterized protein n=1 Tax=Glarea lozoyensis (strain ATCC 74030 / MF5533) TaxID=1104152 RepID=H0EEJ3_GLAL7|nr:hypothetical protein M7I_0871 [Glarea lozoyensis 74030]
MTWDVRCLKTPYLSIQHTSQSNWKATILEAMPIWTIGLETLLGSPRKIFRRSIYSGNGPISVIRGLGYTMIARLPIRTRVRIWRGFDAWGMCSGTSWPCSRGSGVKIMEDFPRPQLEDQDVGMIEKLKYLKASGDEQEFSNSEIVS